MWQRLELTSSKLLLKGPMVSDSHPHEPPSDPCPAPWRGSARNLSASSLADDKQEGP
jgi:hypothetical protein